MKLNPILGLYILILSNFAFASLQAQKMQSDNGDGTYTNPVIFADFPDPDVIRVDSVYYMVSTTMFIFPGVTILKSYDLVNWEYCSNAVQRMDFNSCYNLDGCNRYSHGQWATSLKYHNGTFYLLFITLDEGGFICTSKKPDGPWEIKNLSRGFYDPGLFFDDDGKIYVAHGNSAINITELDTNFEAIGKDSLVFTGDIRSGLEGSHVYKINGYYYLYCTYGGGDGFQVALRSTNIYGPYEEKIVIRDNGNLGTGIHQGALIETQTGEWWSIIFQDGGAFGRFPTLQPVTWQDNWPMLGVNGKGVSTYSKPNVGKEHPITILPTSDEFDSTQLGMQWGWNHNPDSTKWSLLQNPGFLRLSTSKVVTNLRDARNTLTQRIFAYYSKSETTTATIKIDVENMLDGDIAGLGVFQNPYAYIGIKKLGGVKYIVMVNNGITNDSVKINNSIIYLRANAIYGSSKASFVYSFDNSTFKMIGNELPMQFNLSIFTGNKFCLFNYATKATGGFVDIDWFRTDMCSGQTKLEPHIQVNNGMIQDTTSVTINIGDSVTLIPNSFGNGLWSWSSGCGISNSDSIQTIFPIKYCQTTAYFTNTCGVKSSLYYIIRVNKASGISTSFINSSIKIFPNPAHNEIQISSDFFFNQLIIYDTEGRLLVHNTYDFPVQTINSTLELKSGIYLLKLINEQVSETKKLMIL
jgi:beta-xylosidase